MTDALRALVGLAAAIGARFMIARYLLASICALSLDMGVFLALIGAGMPSALAVCGGYGAGLVLHWVISTRFVFTCERPSNAQRIGFFVSALAGLLVTIAIIEWLGWLGLGHALAKLVAIPVSFGTVYAIRKYGIFAAA